MVVEEVMMGEMVEVVKVEMVVKEEWREAAARRARARAASSVLRAVLAIARRRWATRAHASWRVHRPCARPSAARLATHPRAAAVAAAARAAAEAAAVAASMHAAIAVEATSCGKSSLCRAARDARRHVLCSAAVTLWARSVASAQRPARTWLAVDSPAFVST